MSELPIKVTLKSGSGYDAPWVTVDASDPADLKFKLDALDGAVLQAVIDTANALKAANIIADAPAPQAAPAAPAAPAQQQGWGQQQQTPAPSWAAQPAAPSGPELHPTDTCTACGQRPQYKKTPPRKSDGKQFEFWSCPNQKSKGDGHYSEFYN